MDFMSIRPKQGLTICPKWDMGWQSLSPYLNWQISFAVTNKLAALLPEVEKGNGVEQDHTEGHEARDDAEPGEYERALVLAGRGRGDSKDEVDSPEYFC